MENEPTTPYGERMTMKINYWINDDWEDYGRDRDCFTERIEFVFEENGNIRDYSIEVHASNAAKIDFFTSDHECKNKCACVCSVVECQTEDLLTRSKYEKNPMFKRTINFMRTLKKRLDGRMQQFYETFGAFNFADAGVIWRTFVMVTDESEKMQLERLETNDCNDLDVDAEKVILMMNRDVRGFAVKKGNMYLGWKLNFKDDYVWIRDDRNQWVKMALVYTSLNTDLLEVIKTRDDITVEGKYPTVEQLAMAMEDGK